MSITDKSELVRLAEDALMALSSEVCNIIDDIEDYGKTLSPKIKSDLYRMIDIKTMLTVFEETPMALSQTVIGFRIAAPRFISREAFELVYINELWSTMEAFHDMFTRNKVQVSRYNRKIAEEAILNLTSANRLL